MAWRTPFPPSRMPTSIEFSMKLFVCLATKQHKKQQILKAEGIKPENILTNKWERIPNKQTKKHSLTNLMCLMDFLPFSNQLLHVTHPFNPNFKQVIQIMVDWLGCIGQIWSHFLKYHCESYESGEKAAFVKLKITKCNFLPKVVFCNFSKVLYSLHINYTSGHQFIFLIQIKTRLHHENDISNVTAFLNHTHWVIYIFG
jgi:hypothetical protein